MVCSHRCSAEEGTSASLLPETAEEVWNEPQNPQVLLHLHCGSRFKVQGFFICHMINYTGYNQK